MSSTKMAIHKAARVNSNSCSTSPLVCKIVLISVLLCTMSITSQAKSSTSSTTSTLWRPITQLTPSLTVTDPSNIRDSPLPSSTNATPYNQLYSILQALRGGASATAVASTTTQSDKAMAKKKEEDAVAAYRWQQHLYLQSRSLQLRQALIQRGLSALDHQSSEGITPAAKPVDWDCALATEDSPKSCLYSFDAPVGSKVIAPVDTQQWITLSSLVRLRRTDPTKVEPLWHSQYAIHKSWFDAHSSPYSLYMSLPPPVVLLSYLLDTPWVLGLCITGASLLFFVLTLPVWEELALLFMTHPFVWINWPQWGRFVHAALPLKILLGQMAWKGMARVFGSIYNRIRTYLIECECQAWERAIPLTVME
jgi:hypothetical protein